MMVDQAALEKIGPLNVELRRIETGLEIFARGGRITSLTAATAMGDLPAQTVMVDTATMDYPSQMVEAIQAYLQKRSDEIRDELASLGMTGVDAHLRAEPRKSGEKK